MKSLIVFYSYEGNCRLVADWIEEITNSDVLELKPVDNAKKTGLTKYLWGGRQVVMNQAPPISDFNVNFEDYDLIFFGTPVWAGSPAPAFNTFFNQNKITGKKVALFCCCAGGKGKVFEKMRNRLSGNEFIGELELVNPAKKNTGDNHEKLIEWVKGLSHVG